MKATKAWHGAGPEAPMSAWFRRHPALSAQVARLSITDTDFTLHQWAVTVDRRGTRTIKALFDLEVKACGRALDASQQETLLIRHRLLAGQLGTRLVLPDRGPCTVWHFGVFVLALPGLTPDDAPTCRWGHFDAEGRLRWHRLPCAMLPELFTFQRRPDTLQPCDWRRHHATALLHSVERMPLGFVVPTIRLQRS